MIERILAFSHALREAGIPVSQSDLADACSALQVVPILDREAFKYALCACCVKDRTQLEGFYRLFDVFFSSLPRTQDPTSSFEAALESLRGDETRKELDDVFRTEIAKALVQGDDSRLGELVRWAVDRFGGIEASRAVAGVYYAYRTMRQLDAEALSKSLLAMLIDENSTQNVVSESMVRAAVELDMQRLKEAIEKEVTRRLVADRGADAVAKTLAITLPEDIEIIHANREELQILQRAMAPLAKKLATRLAHRHRSKRQAPLDFRRTMRSALSSGGVPIDLYNKSPRQAKPELVLIADISGSVASFARFTMQLVFAMTSQFSKVRSFVFIDAIDEVTDFFAGGAEINEALIKVNTKAKVVWLDGHSDYGHSFSSFEKKWGSEITKRTSVIVCGDARNNYHNAEARSLGLLRDRAKHLFWLNPEPRSYWNTGDSIISQYEMECDGVFECRTLRQLEEFVSSAI